MYRGLRIVAMAPAFNEELKIGEVVRRTPRDVVDEVLVVGNPARRIGGCAPAGKNWTRSWPAPAAVVTG